ncbi:DUF1127 domain-containing protein [Acuticoccus sp. M5D2P5]|uniref:DUF1127 domain-containing protein n=1 Tax=Acuticoccus kalidii TaxID=2910977 RepID=UPI001F2EDF79|nr:DUF1127 domain-containing protein [Acuticoccus kalidii]MCF3936636.1 DUF1127 domain-containing protein [Acuticoccus kalidii]
MLQRITRALHNWRASAETAEQLARLSDEQLRDIGLTRGEIPFVLRQIRTH